MKPGRVFILESPNPLDLLENLGERLALEQVCKLGGYDATTFLLRDQSEFRQTCEYISSIKGEESDKTPLFLHVSVHGNASGIAIGKDTIKWKDLANIVQTMYQHLKFYHGPVVLVLSACGANKQRLTSALTAKRTEAGATYIPPEFIFVFAEETVDWRDAVVTWTIFYREVSRADFSNKTTIKQLLSRLCKSGFGYLKYYRWDDATQKYFSYEPKK